METSSISGIPTGMWGIGDMGKRGYGETGKRGMRGYQLGMGIWRFIQEYQNMEIYGYGVSADMPIWGYGNEQIWGYVDMGTRSHGDMGILGYWHMVIWE